MEKVEFTWKSGRKQMTHIQQAKILNRMGRGTYLTRDMAQTPVKVESVITEPELETKTVEESDLAFPGSEDARTIYEVDAEIKAANLANLENLDKDQLHALAKERGVKVHYNAGADKVREALREALK